MIDKKTITQEELEELKSIQSERGDIVENLGILEINIQDLLLQKNEIISQLSSLKQKENKIGIILQEKYGDTKINLETGELTNS